MICCYCKSNEGERVPRWQTYCWPRRPSKSTDPCANYGEVKFIVYSPTCKHCLQVQADRHVAYAVKMDAVRAFEADRPDTCQEMFSYFDMRLTQYFKCILDKEQDLEAAIRQIGYVKRAARAKVMDYYVD